MNYPFGEFGPHSFLQHGKEIGTYSIDWSFRREGIVAAFKSWLAERHPPAGIHPADGRGHGPNRYVAAFERLAIMRQIFAGHAER